MIDNDRAWVIEPVPESSNNSSGHSQQRQAIGSSSSTWSIDSEEIMPSSDEDAGIEVISTDGHHHHGHGHESLDSQQRPQQHQRLRQQQQQQQQQQEDQRQRHDAHQPSPRKNHQREVHHELQTHLSMNSEGPDSTQLPHDGVRLTSTSTGGVRATEDDGEEGRRSAVQVQDQQQSQTQTQTQTKSRKQPAKDMCTSTNTTGGTAVTTDATAETPTTTPMDNAAAIAAVGAVMNAGDGIVSNRSVHSTHSTTVNSTRSNHSARSGRSSNAPSLAAGTSDTAGASTRSARRQQRRRQTQPRQQPPEGPRQSSPQRQPQQRQQTKSLRETFAMGRKLSFIKRYVGFANRQNCNYKWQRTRGVVGALEIISEPYLNLEEDFVTHCVKGSDDTFLDAMEMWNGFDCRTSFLEACETLPPQMCCCGMLRDDDATKKAWVTMLNDGWCRMVNKTLSKQGFKIDAFLWNWQNASGKAETNIILIRFFETSLHRLRRVSSRTSNHDSNHDSNSDKTSSSVFIFDFGTSNRSLSLYHEGGVGRSSSTFETITNTIITPTISSMTSSDRKPSRRTNRTRSNVRFCEPHNVESSQLYDEDDALQQSIEIQFDDDSEEVHC